MPMIIPLLDLENPDFKGLVRQAWQAVGHQSGADYDSFTLGFQTAITSMLGSLAAPTNS
ncbi:hypothetical protein D3C86_1200490 [compost metagenome]